MFDVFVFLLSFFSFPSLFNSTGRKTDAKRWKTQSQAAYSYDGATIGRLVFEVKTAPNATAQRFACGTAGGKAVNLLPRNYALTSLGVSCATAADLAGSGLPGRKLSQLAPTGLSANRLAVEAGPVWSLEAEVARLTAMGFSGVSFALGVDLYDSALPRPAPLSSIFRSENTSVPVSAASVSEDGSRIVALLAQDPYTLATSRDGGASFQSYHSPLTDAIADSNSWIYSLASSGDGEVLLAGNNPWLNATDGVDDLFSILQQGDAWVSNDGGASWRACNLPERAFDTEIVTVSMAADGQTMVVLTRSRDGEYVDVAEAGAGYTDWQFQEFGPGTVLFYVSTDAGATWTRKGLLDFSGQLGWQVSVEAMRPLQLSPSGERLFLALDLTEEAVTGGVAAPTFISSQIVFSDDQGATWEYLYSAEKIYDFATGGGSGETIAVVDTQGLHLSSDGGDSFALVEVPGGEDGEGDSPGSADEWNSIEVSRNGKYFAAAAEQSYYFVVSNDYGESIEQLPVDPR